MKDNPFKQIIADNTGLGILEGLTQILPAFVLTHHPDDARQHIINRLKVAAVELTQEELIQAVTLITTDAAFALFGKDVQGNPDLILKRAEEAAAMVEEVRKENDEKNAASAAAVIQDEAIKG